jgi:hypothetical protein
MSRLGSKNQHLNPDALSIDEVVTGGDMTKAVYDTNGNGIVDNSEDAQNLGGQAPATYDQSAHVADSSIHLSADERGALDNAATPPTAANPLITAADVTGGGDMTKAVYDTSDDGIVDKAGTVRIQARFAETVTKGQAVYISGYNLGQVKPEVSVADITLVAKTPAVGIASDNVTANNDGEVTVMGNVEGVDTSSWTEGTQLFLSTTGALTSTPGTDQQPMAIVARSNASTGVLGVINNSVIDTSGGGGATTLRVASFLQGLLTDSEKLTTYTAIGAYTLPINLTDSQAYTEVVATAAATIDIQKNGASIGTINFALGANVGTFTFASAVSFVAGDRLQLVNQATADTTLADVSINLKGDL